MHFPDNPDDEESCIEIEEFISAARSGEHRQLNQLLEIYQGYLLAVAQGKLAPDLAVKTSASDIVQETMIQAAHGFAEFRGKKESEFRAWLNQILNRKLLDTHRRFVDISKRTISREVRLNDGLSNADQVAQVTAKTDTPSTLARQTEKVGWVQQALKCLAVDYQQVIQLRNFDQLNFEEIGKRMGRSTQAARKLWLSAIQKLTEELQRYDA